MKVRWKVDSRELTVGKDPSEINETSSLYNNTLFKDFCILWYIFETEEHKVIPINGPVTELEKHKI